MYNSNKPDPNDLPSSAQLIKSTLIALGVATLILFIAVLPAEFGVDPTGVGKVLGLTKMGDIKATLEKEECQDVQHSAPTPVPAVEAPLQAVITADTLENTSSLEDTLEIVLTPGQGAEVKVTMKKGDSLTYQWNSLGGPVNYDTHGENSRGESAKYSRGRQVENKQGTLVASFDGQHGWFWRNKSQGQVKVIIHIKGTYSNLKRLL